MSAGHTPGPWSFDGPPRNVIVWGNKPETRVCFMTSNGPTEANAALIVRAVNAHDDLVEALQGIRDMLAGHAGQPNFYGDIYKIADAAIARATGTSSEDHSLHGEGGR